MKEQKEKRIKRPISIKTINILMISAAVAIIVILILLVVNIQKKYNSLRANTDIYLMCQREAPMMTKASDYLTQQVRSFAVTGETEYINNYFTEVDVNRRREKAIEFLEPYMKDTPAIRYLESALEASNELMEIEYYSMILEWESLGLDRVYIPEDIKNLKLTADDAALSSEEKHQKAIEILFDETYQSYKDTVNADVDSCQNELIEILDTEHNRSYESLTRLLVLLFIMLVIMLNQSEYMALIAGFLTLAASNPLTTYSALRGSACPLTTMILTKPALARLRQISSNIMATVSGRRDVFPAKTFVTSASQ